MSVPFSACVLKKVSVRGRTLVQTHSNTRLCEGDRGHEEQNTGPDIL